MIKTYPLNPRRFERLLTVLALNPPQSQQDLSALLPSLASYDSQGVYPTLPSEVQSRILRRASEMLQGIAEEREKLITLLSTAIQNRPFDAMYPIDQALLLLGAYELQHNQSDPKIIVKEILICSDTLNNQRAGAYLSGILKTLAFSDRPGPAAPPLHRQIAGQRAPKIFLKRDRNERQD